jgi:hypothetical protein
MVNQNEVELFLTALKVKINIFGIVFRPREKNLQTLADLDISPTQRLVYIENLKVENCFSGPNKDTQDPLKPDYFEFGIEINSQHIYIKLSIGLPNRQIDCMSFHIAERPIIFDS